MCFSAFDAWPNQTEETDGDVLKCAFLALRKLHFWIFYIDLAVLSSASIKVSPEKKGEKINLLLQTYADNTNLSKIAVAFFRFSHSSCCRTLSTWPICCHGNVHMDVYSVYSVHFLIFSMDRCWIISMDLTIFNGSVLCAMRENLI